MFTFALNSYVYIITRTAAIIFTYLKQFVKQLMCWWLLVLMVELEDIPSVYAGGGPQSSPWHPEPVTMETKVKEKTD